jgi:cell division protein FtsA
MSEILAFVTFHLKQVGLDNKMLNGGIVLTGGGSQLKHLIQLTEYATGLNARIGYPNEHLAVNHLSELEKPMYATCIGLILKGYNIYENNYKRMYPDQQQVILKPIGSSPATTVEETPEVASNPIKRTKTLSDLMNKMKDGLIDLFKEEGDNHL